MATYNPTATFHSSSTVQTNGQVSDATLLQQAGTDALDNYAYLCGDRSNTGVRRLGSVATLIALKNLDTPGMPNPEVRDEDFIFVESLRALYQYDQGSSVSGDNYSVVTPTSSTGRYLRVGNLPQSTTVSVSAAGTDFFGLFSSTDLPTPDFATGYLTSNANDTATVSVRLGGFNAGDVLTGANISCVTASATVSATDVMVYAITPGTTNTVTLLGTANLTGPLSTITNLTFGSPYTFQTGDTVQVVVAFGGGIGNWTLRNAKVNATRSYITE